MKKHGGKREGAGRPAKYDEPMRQTTIRLPPDWLERLRIEFESVQAGVEKLVREHMAK